jgi:hypothetical protein
MMGKKGGLFCEKCESEMRVFMVSDTLWRSIGLSRNIICLNCFEELLGRSMVKQDLKTIMNGKETPCNSWLGAI